MAPYLAVRLTVVMLVSTGAPLVYANGSFCRASGYPRLEVLGRNCRFLQPRSRAQDRAMNGTELPRLGKFSV